MSMMRSNLVSEFRPLISPGMSPGGLLSHKSRSIAFGNPSGGRLPGQLAKLQLSRVPLPLAITNVRHVRASCSRFRWYDMERPLNWGMITAVRHCMYVIERFGKYYKTITTPGTHFLIPFVDEVAYVHCYAGFISIPGISVTTKDGFFIWAILCVLSVEIVDPKLASYGEEHPVLYLIELAHASTRSEVSKVAGHRIIPDNDILEEKILMSINENEEGIKDRGFRCYKFKICDLARNGLPGTEGERKANNALKPATQGDAEAIIAITQSIAEDIKMVSKDIKAIAEYIASKNFKAEGG